MNVPKFSALLTDIEGTTTSIDFVKNILFPFAVEHLSDYIKKLLADHSDDERRYVYNDLIKTSNEDPEVEHIRSDEDECEVIFTKLVGNIKQWIRQDKKYTALKALQGLIWEDGYRNGQLKADVYSDVPKTFKILNGDAIPIYIYSSGSVKAQQLLFAHTEHGDLTKFISGYFDTNVGPKVEAESYRRIVEQIGKEPSEVLFITDTEKESFAAYEAGLQVRLAVREGNEPLSAKPLSLFKTLSSFDELFQ